MSARRFPAGNLNTRGPTGCCARPRDWPSSTGWCRWPTLELRAEHFTNVTLDPGEKRHPSFWLFAVPGCVPAAGHGRDPVHPQPTSGSSRGAPPGGFRDRGADHGVLAGRAAHVSPLAGGAVGLLVLLVGSVQYHVTQGRRAQFLSRFLSPQVAELVTKSKGLKSATEEKTLELSVVSATCGASTAFSAATSSRRVIEILREYYDMVGAAAAACGGNIKDQAGDGVLILVGAPRSPTMSSVRSSWPARSAAKAWP